MKCNWCEHEIDENNSPDGNPLFVDGLPICDECCEDRFDFDHDGKEQ
jgi:hypothetical protein